MGAGRRGRFSVDGHEFTGWEPANELSDEAQEEIDLIESLAKRRAHDIETRDSLDEKRRRIEGSLVPTCECGWRGLPSAWAPPRSRSRRGGQQHIEHRYAQETKRSRGELGAEMAAAALDHAADAWVGDATVEQWLRARADHIIELGYYDGEEWPSEPTVNDA
ncbi:hypothetical protein [Brachybacterium saurashtrense]|uniref:Uncharacterized protein n=1 Tax=Brachybacterium saurashtrense TaxID=556288 RepID=A0A345YPV5_9MICO|nr:hypothetical protein [Brachybacterium saurashtrense]AXK45957.1 hypothetical protein DWV08_10290 [Brachybacterium saurashtrense]RRR23695.1 hypothetical protein DXU92_02040 [Brachybacterium saurashtrense]